MFSGTVEMLFDRLCQCIRLGFVTARQPEKMRLQVEIKDSPGGRLVTKFLPMLTPRAKGDMQYDLPDIGDQVLVLFLPYGLEQGFVLGAMYGGNNPPTTNPEVWHRTFSDGTVLEYDRAAHKLKADVKGELEAKATGVAALESEERVEIDAPVVLVRGTLVNTASDGGPGYAVFSGNVRVLEGGIEAAGDVVGAGVSLGTHVHPGVESGNSESGPPTGAGGTASGNPAPECEKATPDCIIPCLPRIASAMADRETGDDAIGWRYLSGMFEKWLSGGFNNDADKCKTPYLVDWDWVMSFLRARKAYEDFTLNPRYLSEGLPLPKRNIYNRAAQISLAKRLKLASLDASQKSVSFDDTSAPWQDWEALYYTGMPVQDISTDIDGLFVSLAAFSLRALAAGKATRIERSRWRIEVSEVGVFAHDKFNFEPETGFLKEFLGLGFWSCKHKEMVLSSLGVKDFTSYVKLNNTVFSEYRNKTGIGSDFLVLSQIHSVDNFEGFSYEIDASEIEK